MERDYFEEERYARAEKRLKNIKGFYGHLFWYVFINIVWLGIIIFLNEEESFFKYGFWGMGYGLIVNVFFWGIGLFIHWFVVFGKQFTVSKRWEERKIKELMEKDEF